MFIQREMSFGDGSGRHTENWDLSNILLHLFDELPTFITQLHFPALGHKPKVRLAPSCVSLHAVKVPVLLDRPWSDGTVCLMNRRFDLYNQSQ